MTSKKTIKNKTIDKVTMIGGKVVVYWTETILVETYEDEDNKVLISEEKNFESRYYESDYLPHQDLVKAFEKLRRPFIDAMAFDDYKNIDHYSVTGVKFQGQQDAAKVIIIAQKYIEWSGLTCGAFSSVPIPLYDNEAFGGSKKLDTNCANLLKEAQAYVDGKHAETPQQMSMQFAGGDSVELRIQPD